MKNKFDQNKYMATWKKDNMKLVGAQYKKNFVEDFKEACKKLGISQSDVFRSAMTETIKEAKIEKKEENYMNEHIFETTKRNAIEMLEKAGLTHYYDELLETYQNLSNAIDDYIESNNLDNVSDEKEIKENFEFLHDFMHHDQAVLADFDEFVERMINNWSIESLNELKEAVK